MKNTRRIHPKSGTQLDYVKAREQLVRDGLVMDSGKRTSDGEILWVLTPKGRAADANAKQEKP